MKERLAKLLTVKSMVTMIITIVFAILSLRGIIDGNTFMTVFTMIISFYFGTQHEKTNVEKERRGDPNVQSGS